MLETRFNVHSIFFEPQSEEILGCLLGETSEDKLRVLNPPTWDEFSKYSRAQLESDLPRLICLWMKHEINHRLNQRNRDWMIDLEDYLVAMRWVHRGLTPRLASYKAYLCRCNQEKHRALWKKKQEFKGDLNV